MQVRQPEARVDRQQISGRLVLRSFDGEGHRALPVLCGARARDEAAVRRGVGGPQGRARARRRDGGDAAAGALRLARADDGGDAARRGEAAAPKGEGADPAAQPRDAGEAEGKEGLV